MSEIQITKKEIEQLIEIPGKVRGQVFLTDLEYITLEYITEEKGQEGIVLLKKKMEELENPLDYEKVKTFNWYPVGLRAISLLVIKEVFGFGEKEISGMGNFASKYSFIVRLIMMKHFLSLPKAFQESPKYWAKHYTVGKLETGEFNPKEKYLTLRLKDFKVHPILCTYLFENGYFLRIAQYVLESPKIVSKEIKCMFKEDLD